MGWQFDVTLDRLYCADPESLHSNDKFALAGAVITDLSQTGFVMPAMHPPKHQYSYFPPDLVHIFSGLSNVPRVGLVLRAWDLDENEGWVENRETIQKVASAIATAIGLIPGVGTAAGLILEGISTVVPATIDAFVSWDENDVLLDHTSWVEMPPMAPHTPISVPYSVHFHKSDPSGYTDFDYTLYLTITCQWLPLFANGGAGGRVTEQPFQNSALSSWIGSWEAENVQVDIAMAQTPLYMNPQYLRVTVAENVNGQIVTTTTERVSISRLFVELLQTSVNPAAVENGKASSFVTSAQLVRTMIHGPKVSTRQVLMGAELNPNVQAAGGTPQAAEPVKLLPPQQFQGDYLILQNDASLEIYQLRHNGAAVGEALRYRRPSSMYLSVLGYGTDVMLHRKVLMPH